MKFTVSEITKMAEDRMYNDYYIHADVERKVSTKLWEKGDKKRTYVTIQCYTAGGNYKGAYKCGYVDMISGEAGKNPNKKDELFPKAVELRKSGYSYGKISKSIGVSTSQIYKWLNETCYK